MNHLLQGFEFICAYIDEHFILTKVDWIYHVQKMELTLNKLKESGLRCNIEKSFFGHTEMEYLGLWVTHYGLQPIYNKIEEIKNMTPPTF